MRNFGCFKNPRHTGKKQQERNTTRLGPLYFIGTARTQQLPSLLLFAILLPPPPPPSSSFSFSFIHWQKMSHHFRLRHFVVSIFFVFFFAAAAVLVDGAGTNGNFGNETEFSTWRKAKISSSSSNSSSTSQDYAVGYNVSIESRRAESLSTETHEEQVSFPTIELQYHCHYNLYPKVNVSLMVTKMKNGMPPRFSDVHFRQKEQLTVTRDVPYSKWYNKDCDRRNPQYLFSLRLEGWATEQRNPHQYVGNEYGWYREKVIQIFIKDVCGRPMDLHMYTFFGGGEPEYGGFQTVPPLPPPSSFNDKNSSSTAPMEFEKVDHDLLLLCEHPAESQASSDQPAFPRPFEETEPASPMLIFFFIFAGFLMMNTVLTEFQKYYRRPHPLQGRSRNRRRNRNRNPEPAPIQELEMV